MVRKGTVDFIYGSKIQIIAHCPKHTKNSMSTVRHLKLSDNGSTETPLNLKHLQVAYLCCTGNQTDIAKL